MDTEKRNASCVSLRAAAPEDAAGLLKIYAPYVRDTAITFEYDVPSEEEFRRRIENTLKKYPYLVAEADGELAGYAYASAFKERAAYGWSAELSIYLAGARRGMGIGKILYDRLEEILVKQGVRNLYACIAYAQKEDEYLTNASARFHERLGYRMVGRFRSCGCKFGRWYDMVWMEKIPERHGDEPVRELIPFPDLLL